MSPSADAHDARARRLAGELAPLAGRQCTAALRKPTSNLFRSRQQNHRHRLDVRAFREVLAVHPASATADVEGMATYEDICAATLPLGYAPAVVPQLKTITVGGAVSGLGIESSSFRHGLVHETVMEMEILTGDARLLTCSPTLAPDLFHGFPNSYGTLGYALRLKIRLTPVLPFVHLTHLHFTDPDNYFARLGELCQSGTHDFLDGAVFAPRDLHLTAAAFQSDAPFTSDYTWLRIYHRSIPRLDEDWLTTHDYLWRWDTDWFWCSRRFGLDNPLLRLLATPRLLNSRHYQQWMRWSRFLPDSPRHESVIQDVDIPIRHAPEFLDFLHTRIRVAPIWICPFRGGEDAHRFTLYPLHPGQLYVNFGFWDTLPKPAGGPSLNRLIEDKAAALDGRKALYSTSCYDEETFWRLHNGPAYRELKARYDPAGVFPDLYRKCVLRA